MMIRWRWVLFVALVLSTAVQAQQMMVMDTGIYSHLSDNSARNNPIKPNSDSLRGSHAYFNAPSAAFSNWVTPKNYRDGQMHVILDVFEKPSDIEVRVAICLENPGASCIGQLIVKKPGRYLLNQKPGAMFTGYNPDYTKGFRWNAVLLRDAGEREGKKLDLGQGFIGEPDYSKYVPMKMRARAWVVSVGATFVPPDDSAPPAPPRDAGMPATDAGTLPAFDAGVNPVEPSHALSEGGDSSAPGPFETDEPMPPESQSQRVTGLAQAGCSVVDGRVLLAWVAALPLLWRFRKRRRRANARW